MKKYILALSIVSCLAHGRENLDGKWLTPCINEGQDFEQHTTEVNGSQFSVTGKIFQDANCQSPTFQVFVTTTSQTVGDSQILAGAKEVNHIYSKIAFTALNTQYVEVFNSQHFCGASDWQVGVAKDITGLTCGNESIPKVGDSAYDIYSLKEGKLYFGKVTEEFNGKTPEKRPRQLDLRYVHTKN